MQLPAQPRAARMVALALLISILLGLGGGLGDPPSATAAPDIGLPFFGVDLSSQDPTLVDRAASVGAGFASVPVRWLELQPTPLMGSSLDAAALARLDALIAGLQARGITPVANVAGAPTWAAVNPGGPLLPGADSAYVTFLTALVAHYSAAPYNVHYWTLWSEPDAIRSAGTVSSNFADRGAWGDDPGQFATLLQKAYQVVHQADPNGKVILGPLAYDWFYDPPPNNPTTAVGGTSPGFNSGGIFKYSFIDDILNANPSAKGYFDAVGVNSYIAFSGGWEADQRAKGRTFYDVAAKVAQLRDRLTLKGVDVPIVVGESGFWASGCAVAQLNGDGSKTYTLPATAQNQADYVPKLFARARAAGIQSIAWFTLDESTTADSCGTNHYGLLDASSVPRPAYTAYQRAAALLGPTTRRSYLGAAVVSSSGLVEGYGFAGGGSLVVLVWAADPLAQVTVANGFSATDQSGNAVQPSGHDGQGRAVYNITGSPLVLQRSDYGLYVPLNYRAGLP